MFRSMGKGVILFWATTAMLCGTGFGQLAFDSKLVKHSADPADDQFEVRFPFVNAKSSEVKISQVDSTCGCLKAESDQSAYGPGEKGTVTGVFKLEGRTGTYEKVIRVRTVSEEGPLTQELRVRVTMPMVLQVAPAYVSWEVGAEPEAKKVVFEVQREEPIHVTSAVVSREGFECEVHEIERGRKYAIVLKPGSTEAPLAGVVRVETDCEIEKYRRQVVIVRVNGARKK